MDDLDPSDFPLGSGYDKVRPLHSAAGPKGCICGCVSVYLGRGLYNKQPVVLLSQRTLKCAFSGKHCLSSRCRPPPDDDSFSSCRVDAWEMGHAALHFIC